MPTAAGLHYFLNEGGSTSRPPLVLLHGVAGNHLSWPLELRHLPGHRVFTLDLPGHGMTEEPGRQSVEDYALSVVGFMNAAGLSRAAFIGHAMGGAIALSLALEFPDRAAGIGLLSTGARLPIPSAILENAASLSTLPLAVKLLLEMSFGPQAPANLRETAFERLTTTRHTLLLGDLLACDRFNVSNRIDTIRTSTLVVCGKEDKLTPLRFSENLASQIPGAALQTVEGAGHMLVLEQPRHLAKLIGVFLATVPYQPGM